MNVPFCKESGHFKFISTLCRNLINPILNQLRILNIAENEEYKTKLNDLPPPP